MPQDDQWFEHDLGARLVRLQQKKNHPGLSHDDVLREDGLEMAKIYSDAQIAELLERHSKATSKQWLRFLGQLRAELALRRQRRDRWIIVIAGLTLVASIIAAAGTFLQG